MELLILIYFVIFGEKIENKKKKKLCELSHQWDSKIDFWRENSNICEKNNSFQISRQK